MRFIKTFYSQIWKLHNQSDLNALRRQGFKVSNRASKYQVTEFGFSCLPFVSICRFLADGGLNPSILELLECTLVGKTFADLEPDFVLHTVEELNSDHCKLQWEMPFKAKLGHPTADGRVKLV
jgi:hypothetical protein